MGFSRRDRGHQQYQFEEYSRQRPCEVGRELSRQSLEAVSIQILFGYDYKGEDKATYHCETHVYRRRGADQSQAEKFPF